MAHPVIAVSLPALLLLVSLGHAGPPARFLQDPVSEHRQVYKIALFGDSIMRSGFGRAVGKVTGEYTPDDGYEHASRLASDFLLNDNKQFDTPVRRNVTHTDWRIAASKITGSNYPYGNSGDTRNDICVLASDAAEAVLGAVTGKETIAFIFEGGICGSKTYDTGTAVIEVRTNVGAELGAWQTPSAAGLNGKLREHTDEGNVFAPTLNEFSTAFSYPEQAYRPLAGGNGIAPCRELHYNGLDPARRYEFRIKRKPGETKPVRLFGAYTFSGRTVLILNPSDPGKNWDTLRREIYNTMTLAEVDWAIVEAPIFHDFHPPAVIRKNVVDFVREFQKWGIEVALMSCPPGGLVVTGSSIQVLGTELPNMTPATNFVWEFNHRLAMHIEPVASYADYPDRDAVYRLTVDSGTYEVRGALQKPGKTAFGGWYYKTVFAFLVDETSEALYQQISADHITYPVTFTKVSSGPGAASLTATKRKYMPPRFDVHRDLVAEVCKETGVRFIDAYKAFEKVADKAGETLETEGYPMPRDHALFSNVDSKFRRYEFLMADREERELPAKGTVYSKTVDGTTRYLRVLKARRKAIDGTPCAEISFEFTEHVGVSPVYLGDIDEGVGSLWDGAVYSNVSGQGPESLTGGIGVRRYYLGKQPIKMNHMTNYFSVSDGHHLAYNAQRVIFEVLRDNVLQTSFFLD